MTEGAVRRGSDRAAGITLLQRFVAASLLATVAAGILSGAAAVRQVERYALDQHAHSAAVYVSEFLAPRLIASDFSQSPPSRRVEFEFAMRGLIGKAGILRVTVWNTHEQVLYSDPPVGIRSVPPVSAALEAALSGQTRSRVVDTPQPQGRRPERAMEFLFRSCSKPPAVRSACTIFCPT